MCVSTDTASSVPASSFAFVRAAVAVRGAWCVGRAFWHRVCNSPMCRTSRPAKGVFDMDAQTIYALILMVPTTVCLAVIVLT